ncbi:MAG: acyl-CoA-binding protein [Actinomycetales bacterium]|nr:MAG: acyl-CoA-binding protein [Actinomycetales bacterium]
MSEDFEAAVAAVDTLTRDPGQTVKLRLYALYKQATEGDVRGKRPGMLDFVGRSKYDAWAGLKGTSSDDAEQQYIDMIGSLQAAEGK